MKKPGFKVFHVLDVDFRSAHYSLAEYLQELRLWSDAHPGHTPVFVNLEGKDEPSKNPEATRPEKFTAQTLNELDSDLLKYIGRSHMLTPDHVRGKYPTLRKAVTEAGWPRLGKAKGKFIFLLDDKSEKRALYTAAHPSLRNRVMFTNAEPMSDEAAMMIRNDPNDTEIKQLVQQGFIVRTRADADTEQARMNDQHNFIAAKASGAQIISTDYYRPSTHFKSPYTVNFSDGIFVRINPVTAPRHTIKSVNNK